MQQAASASSRATDGQPAPPMPPANAGTAAAAAAQPGAASPPTNAPDDWAASAGTAPRPHAPRATLRRVRSAIHAITRWMSSPPGGGAAPGGHAPGLALPPVAAADEELPMHLVAVACVGEDGQRAPLRDYIRTQRPTALDGLRDLRGPALRKAVDKLAADFARAQAEPRAAAAAPAAASAPPVRIAETALRGISLPQLRAFLATANSRCKAQLWTSSALGRSGELLTAETMTLYDLDKYVIQPLAHETGLSVVETLASGPQPPAWFVSHWWGEPTADFVKCLEQHCKDRKLDEATTFYWVSALLCGCDSVWRLGLFRRGDAARAARVLRRSVAEMTFGCMLIAPSPF